MSAFGGKADICAAASSRLFDYLVGARKYGRGDVRPSRFGGLEIDYQIEFGRVRGFAPFSIRSTFVEFVVWYDK